jgi:dihydroflavonol-4-reductase
MRVLVTGAAGFLGSHVVAALRADGHEVRALVRPGRPRTTIKTPGTEIAEGDLLDEKSLRQACRGVEALVHCAAQRGNWSRRLREQRQTNVEGTARLYRAAHDHHLARIVHVSTIATLGGDRAGKPRDETAICNLTALRFPYVDSKLESEERARSAAWVGMPVVIVNPGHLAGPRLDGRLPTAVAKLAQGRMRWVPRGGVSVADVADVAQATVAALARGRVGERYVLGGHNLSHLEFYAALARAMGVAPPAHSIPAWVAWTLARGAGALDLARLSRPRFAPEVFRAWGLYLYADSSKAVRELGYAIRPLEEIARRTVGAPIGRPDAQD